MTREEKRLLESQRRKVHWKRWGPYLSERQWGTVREDYSANGDAWGYFPHDHARSRAYRWGEDGIAGFSDRHQRICFALALWNEKDSILKERLFGLSNREGNHAEDVKEYYFYLDATPTSSYLKCLYKYPQAAFPYEMLLRENARRTRLDSEFELLDTGVFRETRYFDVFVEYAKATAEDILIRITAFNRGPDAAPLHLLPTVWFRNKWSWGHNFPGDEKPQAHRTEGPAGVVVVEMQQPEYGRRWLIADGSPELVFTENETNHQRFLGKGNASGYVKDAFHSYLIGGKSEAVNPAQTGTKAAAHYSSTIRPSGSMELRLRLTDQPPASRDEIFGAASFDAVFAARICEADEFYAARAGRCKDEDAQLVQRQAFAGLIWGRQSYHYDVRVWLAGDPNQPPPPPSRRAIRNSDWMHLYNADVISMPDKWEFPWYASWDLAFQCVAMAPIDPDFAKEQLVLFLREWYQHPNGQIPAYEWNFSDVNPPVHAWAAWRVYKIERRIRGKADRLFLERVFHKLLLNFTWWVNRKDPRGLNVFEGGFLGLDNIGVFDRSRPIIPGGIIEQSDGTSWMAMFCLNLLAMAIELAREDPAYEDVASKFFEHFVYIAHAMDDMGGEGFSLWDEEDGFYYDVVHLPNGQHLPLKIRSMVGLIPLFAVAISDWSFLEPLGGFLKRMQWFLDHRPEVREHVAIHERPGCPKRIMLSITDRRRLERILRYLLDESEFLSAYGVRALSKYHRDHPFVLHVNGETHAVGYEPAETSTDLFGGNSNWRGPVWFPLNFLLIESLQRYHHFFGDELQAEFPTGSGQKKNLWEIAAEISGRLIDIFLRRDGQRGFAGPAEVFQNDPHWRDLILFYEYFHGDTGRGLGASHQTGWTALVAKLIEQSCP